MKKRAAIITFHCVPNYGAVLQAYALQSKLKEIVGDAGIVDYRPDRITQEYKNINTYSCFSFAASLWSLRQFLEKKEKFKQFEKDYFDLIPCEERNGTLFVRAEAEKVFLGSDQIWNPDITHGFDKVYFGGICEDIDFKAVAYAASIGKKNFSMEESREFTELIEQVDIISVREKEAQQLLLNDFGKKSEVVVDPTILAGKDCFERLVEPLPYKNYILFYSLTGMPEAAAMAEKVARYFGYKLIELSGRRKPYILPNHTAIYNAGPIEFVSLFHDAEFVVTDSFHGTVFSLLFHKNFISLANKKRGGRITGLLDAVGLLHRCTDRFDRDIIQEKIDWKAIDKKIESMRESSLRFLTQALEE